MTTIEMLDALDQSLELLTLLEITCAGMETEEAPGINIVLHEIEVRTKAVREGIDATRTK